MIHRALSSGRRGIVCIRRHSTLCSARVNSRSHTRLHYQHCRSVHQVVAIELSMGPTNMIIDGVWVTWHRALLAVWYNNNKKKKIMSNQLSAVHCVLPYALGYVTLRSEYCTMD